MYITRSPGPGQGDNNRAIYSPLSFPLPNRVPSPSSLVTLLRIPQPCRWSQECPSRSASSRPASSLFKRLARNPLALHTYTHSLLPTFCNRAYPPAAARITTRVSCPRLTPSRDLGSLGRAYVYLSSFPLRTHTRTIRLQYTSLSGIRRFNMKMCWRSSE